MNREFILNELAELRKVFYEEIQSNQHNISEETVRSGYLNKVLDLFGWNLSMTTEVIQEKVIAGDSRERLNSIGSRHSRPDYRLLDRGILRMYLDAKTATEDYRNSKATAFQIRSYGWSSQIDLSIVSNFEHFTVYDTTFQPNEDMEALYRTIHFSIDDLINDFDRYSQFLDKTTIQTMSWELSSFDIELHKSDNKKLDAAFLELISDFRLKLGEGLNNSNSTLTPTRMEYYIQLIINRLIFLRTLEDINMEPHGTLREWITNNRNFWSQFNNSSETNLYHKYDGVLFEEKIPQNIKIDDQYFSDFIHSLYGSTPYKFDVIEPALIAEIYDLFLGQKLNFDNDNVSISYKKLSPSGSIPTPANFSRYVVNKVVNLDDINSIEELLTLRILDPCAGSGSFLIEVYELLLQKLNEIEDEKPSYTKAKNIIKNCIYGVDIDPIAIEVLKMTISLKLIVSDYEPVEPMRNLLSDLDSNFKLGNSIVEKDIYDYNSDLSSIENNEQIPTSYRELFPNIIEGGGFSHILTNPPYIEPKHFRKNWPQVHEYLKDKYISKSGKSDISLFFLEKVLKLLKQDGRFGIIMQSRFLKTEYGKNIRAWLADNGYLKEVKEYAANNIFKDKTTYIVVLEGEKKQNDNFRYIFSNQKVSSNRSNLEDVLQSETHTLDITKEILNDAIIWSYRYFKASSVLNKLMLDDNFITLNSEDRFDVKVGPQVLDKKYYVLRESKKVDNYIEGVNQLNKKIKIEEALVRPLYENDNMYPYTDFSTIDFSTYIIFPYNEDGTLISLEEVVNRYPFALNYFEEVKERTNSSIRKKEDEFYGYTRTQNLTIGHRPKIFIPMTAKRVTASLSEVSVFGDNSNINAIVDYFDDVNILKSYCVILNSKLFNLLAIHISSDANNGYYKLNKQFIGNVPLPILSEDDITYLSDLYDKILQEISSMRNGYGEMRNYHKNKLDDISEEVNSIVENMYSLSDADLQTLKLNIDDTSLDWILNIR
ncbi:Eco57I restriction-modification methylase domain-containing protein [Salinicoccus roseus]|uniref:Eco57I restriction-modification methylase domain-containing protein n=1 Tax=Salinicoccus roseus TaxID=45670 RepID=UPI002300A1CF|nr:N-6 DNA methylase [Salinicoccus roseus]